MQNWCSFACLFSNIHIFAFTNKYSIIFGYVFFQLWGKFNISKFMEIFVLFVLY